MSAYPQFCPNLRVPLGQYFVVAFIFSFGFVGFALGQTASTGALMGVTLDPSSAVIRGRDHSPHQNR